MLSLFMVNSKRSVLFGALLAAGLKTLYLYIVHSTGAINTASGLPAWNSLFKYGLFGWAQLPVCMGAALLTLPFLFYARRKRETA
jgi:hypothetical protein